MFRTALQGYLALVVALQKQCSVTLLEAPEHLCDPAFTDLLKHTGPLYTKDTSCDVLLTAGDSVRFTFEPRCSEAAGHAGHAADTAASGP